MIAILFSIYICIILSVVTVMAICIFAFVAIFCWLFRRDLLATATRRFSSLYWKAVLKFVPIISKPEYLDDQKSSDGLHPAVIVANHVSAVDPALFGVWPFEFSMIATWPFRIPIYGFFMRMAGYIDASLGSNVICDRAVKLLKQGVSVVIWPEGTRSRDGKLQRFKNGAFVIAFDSGMPIVPICILGTHSMLKPDKHCFTPCRTRMIVLPPIYPDLKNDREHEIIRLRKAAFASIAEVLTANGQ